MRLLQAYGYAAAVHNMIICWLGLYYYSLFSLLNALDSDKPGRGGIPARRGPRARSWRNDETLLLLLCTMHHFYDIRSQWNGVCAQGIMATQPTRTCV